MRFYPVKLIRDRIVVDHTTIATAISFAENAEDREFAVGALRRKLVEEAIEYLQNPCLEELADVQEVIHALCAFDLEASERELKSARVKKLSERGGFMDLRMFGLDIDEAGDV